MSHSNVGQTNFIGTHESIYRDSPIGNQETFLVRRSSPLQQGFDGNIKTCLSIGVHDNSTFLASEQGIVSTVMSLPNSTAVGTELGRMPRINDIQRNIPVKAPLFKVLLEGKERNPHNFTIESFSFGTEAFKILNGNVSIISQSHFSNISYNFTNTVLHKIMLISFSPIKCLYCISTSSITITLQNGLPLKQLFAPFPNILSKVVLMQNLSFRGKNRNRKAFAVYIDSKNILLQRQFKFVIAWRQCFCRRCLLWRLFRLR